MILPVKIQNLQKTYKTKKRQGLFKASVREVEALKGVSLEIQPGEIFGLLGPNGAGKTTLIKCLTTLLLPSGGRAWINGFELTKQDDAIRATVGCMLMGERGLYWKLTGRENLVFFGALYHLPPAERARRADTIIERLNLGEFADRPVETYSSGQKMKLAFAKALINDAPLLILDDLGTESATAWAREKLYQLFNYRYTARLPTIITTATPIDEIDPRLATRMLDGSRCTFFLLEVPSYRGGIKPKQNRKR